MKDEKSCFNCRYFSAHYVKTSNGLLLQLQEQGHCTNLEMQFKHSNKIIKKHGVCKLWEDETIKFEERKLCIFKRLELMRQYLFNIEQMLKDDLNKSK